MRGARSWYEMEEEASSGSGRRGDAAGSSSIVRKSKYIHETLLQTTDPELAEHLKAMDVLPQVFLMWVRVDKSEGSD